MLRFPIATERARNAAALFAAFASLAVCVGLLGIVVHARNDALPTGNEFTIAACGGSAVHVLLLALVQPRLWAVAVSILAYALFVLPVTFAFGCGWWGACI